MFDMKLLLCIFITLSRVGCDDDSGWSLVGNPLRAEFACENSTDVTVSYESGLRPEDENMYSVHIYKKFPVSTEIVLKLDADASVTLLQKDKSLARVSLVPDQDEAFVIHLFKDHGSIHFEVKGLVPGTVPYIKSLKINTKEYCQKSNVGFLDPYLLGYNTHAETPKKIPATSCGRRKVAHTGIIANGEPTKAGDWPWHAAVYRVDKASFKYICGGTLLSKTHVLTAAHCLYLYGFQMLPETVSVVLGKANLIVGDADIVKGQVREIIIHNLFLFINFNNDIALLKLRNEAVYTDYVQPACLWYSGAEKLQPDKGFGTVVGWSFDGNNSPSPQLAVNKLRVVSNFDCLASNSFLYYPVLNYNKFCAGPSSGTSMCNTYSGGAFQVFVKDKDTSTEDGAWLVRGILSLSRLPPKLLPDWYKCDRTQYEVFINVNKYLDWINQNMLT